MRLAQWVLMQQATVFAKPPGAAFGDRATDRRHDACRVEIDAYKWTNPGINDVTLGNTAYLSQLRNVPIATDWFTPESKLNTAIDAVNPAYHESSMFDANGNDVTDAADSKFCVHMREGWVERYTTARVEVRVIWLRDDPSRSEDAVAGDYLATTNCVFGSENDLDPAEIPNMRQYAVSKLVRYTRP
ncbi:MAG: hypothetical protein R3A47_10160 [Polyangiales bacterium]